ncbi:MAG: hypothetical protein M2R45_02803 [Verrucomicrobia subdivision 3 bacterium]|nr:hypothetical protein [Limisphaerales bacterium]MCS1414355.1 hypothetical protein [Limisphaerales bacterium]
MSSHRRPVPPSSTEHLQGSKSVVQCHFIGPISLQGSSGQGDSKLMSMLLGITALRIQSEHDLPVTVSATLRNFARRCPQNLSVSKNEE